MKPVTEPQKLCECGRPVIKDGWCYNIQGHAHCDECRKLLPEKRSAAMMYCPNRGRCKQRAYNRELRGHKGFEANREERQKLLDVLVDNGLISSELAKAMARTVHPAVLFASVSAAASHQRRVLAGVIENDQSTALFLKNVKRYTSGIEKLSEVYTHPKVLAKMAPEAKAFAGRWVDDLSAEIDKLKAALNPAEP